MPVASKRGLPREKARRNGPSVLPRFTDNPVRVRPLRGVGRDSEFGDRTCIGLFTGAWYVSSVHLSRASYGCYPLGQMNAPASVSLAPDLPLRFVGGDPSLDLVNTVDWAVAGPKNERLVNYARLLEWGTGAGIIDDTEAAQLARVATMHPRDAQKAYGKARFGRWILQRLYTSLVEGRISAIAIEEFNILVRSASANLVLVYVREDSGAFERRASRPNDLDVVLWKTVRAAETFLMSNDIKDVRICDGPNCGWLYVDRSRNGLRRWCEMATCGTQAKSIRRAARRKASRAPRSTE
jgi:predicted RNA-binding Zn ribbon-like protein